MAKTLAILALTVLPAPLLLAATDAEESADGAETGFGRYQPIIDRMPFGEPPPGVDLDSPPGASTAAASSADDAKAQAQLEQEQRQLLAQIKVTMLNITPQGEIAVGFKAEEQSYYLLAGQSKNGWEVLGADVDTQEVTFRRDGVEVTVQLGGQSGGAAGARGGAVRPAPATTQSARPGGTPGVSPAPLGAEGGFARLRERRRLRQEAEDRQRLALEEERRRQQEREQREAQEKAEREQREAADKEEKAQMRQQLSSIAEELRRRREAQEQEKKDASAEGESEAGDQ